MNKRQAKKQYKKIHGHNPPKTAVTKYTPEEMEVMKVYNFTPEDIGRIVNGLRDAFVEALKILQRVAESMRSEKEYKVIREEIYRFIGAYITKHVYAPSDKEIAEGVGISATTVHRHLIDMIDEGILETDEEPRTQRAIRIRNTQVVKRRKKE